MNTGGGRGGPFVQNKQQGTRLHLSVGGGDTFLYLTVMDLCVSQVLLLDFACVLLVCPELCLRGHERQTDCALWLVPKGLLGRHGSMHCVNKMH